MTASVLLLCLLMGSVSAVVELKCSKRSCLEGLAVEVARNLRQQRAVRIFDAVTIEPLARQARSREGWWSWIENNAVSFDWNDFTFKVAVPEGRDDALDLEMYESRTVAEKVPDVADKKSSSKVEDEKEEAPKRTKLGLRRRQKKKVFQALIPLLFGMKSAGAVIFAFTLVAVLTLKAFVASKLALIATVGMAAKKLYETYSIGVGLHNNPYLYSQYPIDFPSASSHAYSASGVSPQFASQEMYTPTAMGAQAQTHDILQSQDARAQQSQQAPTQLLLNSTNAEQRWDGKSAILKYLEPFISTFKSVVSPITNALYGAMPTVRGLSSDVSTAKNVEANVVSEVKKPKEYLVPQPRFIRAQRKNFRKTTTRPKKHTELKIDLDRLKHNKDLHDYMKTKKYKYNYPNTYFYPRVKYVLHPNSFYHKPNNSRLIPYRKIHTTTDTSTTEIDLSFADSDWQPVLIVNNTTVSKNDTKTERRKGKKGHGRKAMRRFFRRKPNLKQRKRIKRDLADVTAANINLSDDKTEGRYFFDIFSYFFSKDPVDNLFVKANKYAKSYLKEKFKSTSEEPTYYTIAYNVLVTGVDILDGIINVGSEMHEHYLKEISTKKKIKIMKKKKVKINKKRQEEKIKSYCAHFKSKDNSNNINSKTSTTKTVEESEKEMVTTPESA